jgi:hypothetical protein
MRPSWIDFYPDPWIPRRRDWFPVVTVMFAIVGAFVLGLAVGLAL